MITKITLMNDWMTITKYLFTKIIDRNENFCNFVFIRH